MDFVDYHSNIGVGKGSPEVIDGVLVQTSVDKMMILQKFPERQYRALVVYLFLLVNLGLSQTCIV
jgi:hypothetical protein